MKKIFLIVFFFTLLESYHESNKETSLWFSKVIHIAQNCQEDSVSSTIEIQTDSRKNISIHSFDLVDHNFTILYKGKEIDKSTILHVKKRKPLLLELKHRITDSQNPRYLKFKTNHPDFLKNKIEMLYGSYIISNEDIRKGVEQVFKITESCSDSIVVRFPYGGTVSGVTLYKDSSSLDTPYKSISYMFKQKNYLKFSKNEIDKYYISYRSCHWRNNFWLVLK